MNNTFNNKLIQDVVSKIIKSEKAIERVESLIVRPDLSSFMSSLGISFLGTGTYTPTAGMTHCIVVAIGGGGGGGGADCTDTTALAAGGGGEGGGIAIKAFTAAEIGANAVVTIGAAGTAGSADGGNGGDGGDTIFNPAGTCVTVTGLGGDGGDGAVTAGFAGGAGGAGESGGTNGDINLSGEPGLTGLVTGVGA